ncbi:cupredoxin domain-containing protein [Longimicrobium sp.]|uniref:cupredoxin domain-containing protein n=1 Tax=Longimicrobium sp. TaxID=2029185 RepID=UPI002CC2B811|nr:plastocyanin/azurin family copper-binding protein [Longimicrobium sp.]HSU16877.1 plastocyanin/azurin family copper-binding protein [Longimicrobium sp.]
MRAPLRAAALAAAALALAACGGGRPHPPERHTVELRNFGFSPASLAVRPGDEVVFVNRDAVPHTATADDRAWDTGSIAAGDSAVVKVTGGGTYKCTFHPTMTGTLAASGTK